MNEAPNAHALWVRAVMLMQQGRYDHAERELRGSLAMDPQNALAHAHLALSLHQLKRPDEAMHESNAAVGLDPVLPYAHFVKSVLLSHAERYPESLASARQAVALDPDDADYHAHEASVHLRMIEWKSALEAAERALQIDPEHQSANNVRAIALTKLGRKIEAGQTIESTLRRDPENATSHANMGWTRLHQGRAREAAESFRESLRLQPSNEWAREGLVTALKARNPIYGLFLRYALFMGSLKPGVQFGLLIGVWFAPRLINGLGKAVPAIAPFTPYILIAFIGFAVSSWLADPLFNLVLRLHPLGRYALNARERWSGNVLGICILLSLTALAFFWIRAAPHFLLTAMALIFSAIPLTGALHSRARLRMIALFSLGGLSLLLAGISLVLNLTGHHSQGSSVALGAIITAVVSTWIGAGLALARRN